MLYEYVLVWSWSNTEVGWLGFLNSGVIDRWLPGPQPLKPTSGTSRRSPQRDSLSGPLIKLHYASCDRLSLLLRKILSFGVAERPNQAMPRDLAPQTKDVNI